MKVESLHEASKRSLRGWILGSTIVLSLMCAIYSPVLFAWSERTEEDSPPPPGSFTYVQFNWIMRRIPSFYVPLMRFHGWTQSYEALNKDGVTRQGHGFGYGYGMTFIHPEPH